MVVPVTGMAVHLFMNPTLLLASAGALPCPCSIFKTHCMPIANSPAVFLALRNLFMHMFRAYRHRAVRVGMYEMESARRK